MRSRGLTLVALTAAVVLAWLNGLFAHWWQTTFRSGDAASRADHLVSAGACLATALLLFAGMLALFVFRPPFWLLVVTALGVGTQLALAITSYRTGQGMDEDPISTAATGTFGHGFARALELPGSWPLLVVLVVALVLLARRRVRGSSSRAPR